LQIARHRLDDLPGTRNDPKSRAAGDVCNPDRQDARGSRPVTVSERVPISYKRGSLNE